MGLQIWMQINNKCLLKWFKDKCLLIQVRVCLHRWCQDKWGNKVLIPKDHPNTLQTKTLLYNNIQDRSLLHKACTLQYRQEDNSQGVYRNNKCHKCLLVMCLHSSNKDQIPILTLQHIICLQCNKILIRIHLLMAWITLIWWLCSNNKVKYRNLIRQFNSMLETYNLRKLS